MTMAGGNDEQSPTCSGAAVHLRSPSAISICLKAELYVCIAPALYSADDCIQRRLLKLLLAVDAHPDNSSKNAPEQIDLKIAFMTIPSRNEVKIE